MTRKWLLTNLQLPYTVDVKINLKDKILIKQQKQKMTSNVYMAELEKLKRSENKNKNQEKIKISTLGEILAGNR